MSHFKIVFQVNKNNISFLGDYYMIEKLLFNSEQEAQQYFKNLPEIKRKYARIEKL